jgi:hypothetical protein
VFEVTFDCPGNFDFRFILLNDSEVKTVALQVCMQTRSSLMIFWSLFLRVWLAGGLQPTSPPDSTLLQTLIRF